MYCQISAIISSFIHSVQKRIKYESHIHSNLRYKHFANNILKVFRILIA